MRSYNLIAMVWKVELRFLPTSWNADMAATEIRAAIKPYSLAVPHG